MSNRFDKESSLPCARESETPARHLTEIFQKRQNFRRKMPNEDWRRAENVREWLYPSHQRPYFPPICGDIGRKPRDPERVFFRSPLSAGWDRFLFLFTVAREVRRED